MHALERLGGVPTGQPKGAKLRQREVARVHAEGYSRQRIATALGISQATVNKDLRDAPAIDRGNSAVPTPAEWPLTADADRRPAKIDLVKLNLADRRS